MSPKPALPSAQALPTWLAIGILALLSVLCCAPLWQAGWFANHEEVRPIARALAAWYEIADGDLYPRWLSVGYLGKGVPLFDFYSPAFSLLVAYGHALGVPLLLSAKLVHLLLFFTGALGTWLWTRPHLGRFPALVTAVLYLFAPYHFLDAYVRGASAEFSALAPLPYVFLGIDLLIERLSARALATLATASAGIVLSHFLSALMIAPFAVVYALARVLMARGGWRALARVAGGGALGAALSAFFWLPALVERSALSSARAARVTAGYYSAFRHFVHPLQWLDPTWGFGISVPDGYDDTISFQVGILVAASVIASVLVLRWLDRPARRFVLLTFGLGAGALWLTSPASAPWYEWLPTYQLVQFPWRFLGPATVFLAAAGGGLARLLAERRRWLGPGVAAATAALAVLLSGEQRTVLEPVPLADDRASIEKVVFADEWSMKFGNEDEYLPKDASPFEALRRRLDARPVGLGVEIGPGEAKRAEMTFEVTVPSDHGIAVVPFHYFPGWKATLDGRDWPVAPGPGGLIALGVPEGRHVARVYFGTTPPRVAGWLLCLAALLALAGLAVRERIAWSRPAVTPAPTA